MSEENDFNFLKNFDSKGSSLSGLLSLHPTTVVQCLFVSILAPLLECCDQSQWARVHYKVEKPPEISRLQTGKDQPGLHVRGDSQSVWRLCARAHSAHIFLQNSPTFPDHPRHLQKLPAPPPWPDLPHCRRGGVQILGSWGDAPRAVLHIEIFTKGQRSSSADLGGDWGEQEGGHEEWGGEVRRRETSRFEVNSVGCYGVSRDIKMCPTIYLHITHLRPRLNTLIRPGVHHRGPDCDERGWDGGEGRLAGGSGLHWQGCPGFLHSGVLGQTGPLSSQGQLPAGQNEPRGSVRYRPLLPLLHPDWPGGHAGRMTVWLPCK